MHKFSKIIFVSTFSTSCPSVFIHELEDRNQSPCGCTINAGFPVYAHTCSLRIPACFPPLHSPRTALAVWPQPRKRNRVRWSDEVAPSLLQPLLHTAPLDGESPRPMASRILSFPLYNFNFSTLVYIYRCNTRLPRAPRTNPKMHTPCYLSLSEILYSRFGPYFFIFFFLFTHCCAIHKPKVIFPHWQWV